MRRAAQGKSDFPGGTPFVITEELRDDQKQGAFMCGNRFKRIERRL